MKDKKTRRYKEGDIVLVKSVAGDAIPHIHVRLVKRVVVKPTPPKRVGFKMSMDWPGYSGWESEVVYQHEADLLRKKWSIPFKGPGDSTFVYDSCIIKKESRRKTHGGKTTRLRKKKVERSVDPNNNSKSNKARVRNKNKKS